MIYLVLGSEGVIGKELCIYLKDKGNIVLKIEHYVFNEIRMYIFVILSDKYTIKGI